MALIVVGSCPFALARPIFLEDDGEYLVDYEVALGVRRAVANRTPKGWFFSTHHVRGRLQLDL